jgi:hypothetical protein
MVTAGHVPFSWFPQTIYRNNILYNVLNPVLAAWTLTTIVGEIGLTFSVYETRKRRENGK